jgi:serine phosphatase RsbU (regulator of sigma subunit)
VLSSSLDYEQTLQRVARLAVPELADWCAVFILEDELDITSGHPDPEVEEMLLSIRAARRGEEGASESRRVAESGQSILVHDARGGGAAEVDERQLGAFDRLAAKSYMLVPLRARGRSLGSLTLLSSREGRHYTEADKAFAETLAGRCAVAIDNARLFRAEREARARADFLARAGVLLDETLDYERTLRSVADIAVPEIANWCGLSVLDGDGRLQQVAAAHIDPEQRRLGEELNRRYPPDRDAESGSMRVARTGRTEFVPEITEAMIDAGIPDEEQRALVKRLDLRSVIIAPLRARARTFGTLTLANTGPSRRFGEADVQLAEELARRAGTAIDNARLYTERTHIAHTLQARLLPARLPDVPGAMLAARYRAAGELNEVGGDFYDVFPRSEEEWAMVVGDVSGKGPEAAAVTALARYTLRAGALDDDAPAKALRRLNSALRAHDDSAQYATAALAYLSTAERGLIRVRLALAGHPPAMIVRADGAVDAAGAYGDMLALDGEPTFRETELRLAPGDVLLLYTDGVTEAGPRDRPFGEFGFAELLGGLAGAAPQAVVDAVEEAVVDAHGGEPRDDIALLALALRP